jgi:hypothetical protein
MTRKDFQLVADAIVKANKMGGVADLETLAHVMAESLATTNCNFKLNIFLDACGVEN